MSDCSKVKAYWSIFNNQLDLGAHMGALGYVITLGAQLGCPCFISGSVNGLFVVYLFKSRCRALGVSSPSA